MPGILDLLVEMSNRYGADDRYVLAGGGNTSAKADGCMYVKGSGTSLAAITADGFVKMDTAKVKATLSKEYPADDDAREALALADMMAARLPGEEHKRPSVEALLHAIFPYTFVLHLHPALVNGLSCSQNGELLCREVLGADTIWVGLIKPGYTLGRYCFGLLGEAQRKNGKYPQIAVLQNHGIFIAADTVEEIDRMMAWVMHKLESKVDAAPDLDTAQFDINRAVSIAPALRMLYGKGKAATAKFSSPKALMAFSRDETAMEPLMSPFSPDHIVYCKAVPMYLKETGNVAECFAAFEKKHGYMPKIVVVQDLGFFALGMSQKDAQNARAVFLDALKIAVYSRYFGGAKTLPDDFTAFILGWEVENYRTAVALAGGNTLRMDKKVCVITGAAQGFGQGIAEELAAQGAYVVIADINPEGARESAGAIREKYGEYAAAGCYVNVCDENTVRDMIYETALTHGGIDLLVSNAGILIAGGLSEMTLESFERVTAVNYTGYFLCVKHASEIMKIQHQHAPGYMTDIIEVNSKSGLEGSNKNFAYAGGKFGGIGLTQSFALELVEHGVKVNAVCPGNLLDGPLWSDPERGLFRQYLDAGKVPGAKTVADVRRFYENRVPMKRGCTVHDVALAIMYICEQQYETGQALPVTGGQVMLK
ncbi:MAG: SDR family oxidoreductase [Oscillospiraceae bacterium]|nr:SDR family oxidoreductase [Oscillospiraceae bacterium]